MKHLIKNLLQCLAIFVISACSYDAQEYTKAIPNDADVVAKIEFSQLDAKAIPQELSNLFGVGQALESFLDDPASLGLRLDKPVFVWARINKDEMGLCAEVYDAKKIHSTLEKLEAQYNINFTFREEDGLNWVSYYGIEGKKLAYNDKSLYIISSSNPRRTLTKLLKSDESYVSTTRMKKLLDAKGLLVAESSIERFVPTAAGSDLHALLSVSINSSSTKLQVLPFSIDEKGENLLKEIQVMLTPLKGEYTSLADETCLTWMSLSVNEKLLSYVENDQDLSETLDISLLDDITLPEVLAGCNGDCTISLHEPTNANIQLPVLYLFAKCNQEDKPEKLLSSLSPSISLLFKKSDSHQYSANIPFLGSLYLGQQKDDFYFSNKQILSVPSEKVETLLRQYSDKLSDLSFYWIVRGYAIDKLLSAPFISNELSVFRPYMPFVRSSMKKIEDVELSLSTDATLTISVHYKNVAD